MSFRGRFREIVGGSRIVNAAKSDSFRIISVLGLVGVLMTASAAGVLSGAGLFLLAMIEMETTAVIGSAVLLAASTAVLLSCYLWLTP